MRSGFLSPGRGVGRSMKLYGKCRFSGYHFSQVPEKLTGKNL